MRGMIAAFSELDATVEAVQELKDKKFMDIVVYTPTPRHEIDEVMKAPQSPVRLFTLIGGLLGLTFGYWIAVWVSDYWPLVVGGKAIVTWIPYTIIGFEVMVLCGALATVFGMFINSRLPKLTMTVGYDGRFSQGDYGVWVETTPDRLKDAEEILRRHGAVEVRGER
jgi:hypothetical protein